MELTCPQCKAQMRSYKAKGLTLDQCRRCRGFWFDVSEIEAYLRASDGATRRRGLDEKEFRRPKARASHGCPRCASRTLAVGRLHGFPYFKCVSCRGIFVAHRRLEKLVRQGEKGGGSSFEGLLFEPLQEILIELIAGQC